MTVPAIIEARDLAPVIADGANVDAAVALLEAQLGAFVVTRDNMDQANALAKGIRKYKQQIEDSRAGYSRQPLDELERIRSCYRGALAKLDGIYAHLTAGTTAVVQAERIEQQRALAQAAATGAGPAEIARAVAAAAPKPSGTREMTYYSAIVRDPSKVPAKYWRIDLDALNAEAKTAKDAFAVEGCELVKDVRVVPV